MYALKRRVAPQPGHRQDTSIRIVKITLCLSCFACGLSCRIFITVCASLDPSRAILTSQLPTNLVTLKYLTHPPNHKPHFKHHTLHVTDSAWVSSAPWATLSRVVWQQLACFPELEYNYAAEPLVKNYVWAFEVMWYCNSSSYSCLVVSANRLVSCPTINNFVFLFRLL